MPLLLCPNCNTSMQAVNRSGVELDICPTCRGVWLDRGELEKILGDERQVRQADADDRRRFDREVDDFRRDPDDWRKRHPVDPRDNRHAYEGDRHRRKKGFNIFDILD